MTRKNVRGKTITGLSIEVRKDCYFGLWNIYYTESEGLVRFDGPFKTKKEAVKRLRDLEYSE